MTISSTTRIAGPFIGNGTASAFPFTFKVFAATDLDVIKLTVSTGTESTLVLTTDYTVSLNGDQNSNPGGTVTLTAGALASGFTLTITSDIANLQPTDLTNQGGFYPEVITDSLDRATIQIQQIADIGDRTLKIPISDGTLNMELPTKTERANSFLSFDANGLPSVVTAGSSGAPATITRQVFSGTGSQTVFTLASDPGALGNSAQVYIGGVYQQRSTYTIAGTTLTFSAAPVAGTDNIEFVNFLTSNIGATSADLVTYTQLGSGVTATSVAVKLQRREVRSISNLRTLTGTFNGEPAYLIGRTEGSQVGGGMFLWSSASTATDNDGTIIGAGASGRWLRVVADVVETDWFGVSDTGSDTTAALVAAVAASANKTLLFNCTSGTSYFSSAELSLPSGCTIELNGSTLTFFRPGQLYLFTLNNVQRCSIRNGTILNTGGNLSLSMDGYRQTIRCFNVYRCSFSNLTFGHAIGVVPCIAVYGNSNDIDVENILATKPSGYSNINTVFISHWWWNTPSYDKAISTHTQVAAAYPSNPSYLFTNHPNNIRVKNITSDHRLVQGLWFSSSFNVTVENVNVESEEGIYVSPGDYGVDYANPQFVGKVSKNIAIENFVQTNGAAFGIYITANGSSSDLGAATPVPALVSVSNFLVAGGTGAGSGFGVFMSGEVNTRLALGRIYGGWQYGIAIGNACYGVEVRDVQVYGCTERGISVASSSGQPAARNVTIEDCWIYNNNTGNTAVNTNSGVYITNAEAIRVSRNEFGLKTGTENQRTSVYLASTNGTVTNASLFFNHTYSVNSATGWAYQTLTASNLLVLAANNSSDTTSVYAGDYFYELIGYGKKRLVFDGSSGSPATGTWAVGDNVVYRTPTSGGYIGSVCTTAGTPGTWKSYGLIT
jgi:hypothetical protein